jgi:hypothetical protein
MPSSGGALRAEIKDFLPRVARKNYRARKFLSSFRGEAEGACAAGRKSQEIYLRTLGATQSGASNARRFSRRRARYRERRWRDFRSGRLSSSLDFRKKT